MSLFVSLTTPLDQIPVCDRFLQSFPKKLVYSSVLVSNSLSPVSSVNDAIELPFEDYLFYCKALVSFIETDPQLDATKTLKLSNDIECAFVQKDQSKSLIFATAEFETSIDGDIKSFVSAFYDLILTSLCYPAVITFHLYDFIDKVTMDQLKACDRKMILSLIETVQDVDHYILLHYITRNLPLIQELKRLKLLFL